MSLQELNLEADGDRHERRMWPLVAKLFPSYQIFWRSFIVPMSYRTDHMLTKLDPQWYRLRSGIPPHFERLAMAHYSVFYWTARGMERLKVAEASYPEDVLFLFDSALDCLDIFIADVRRVAKDCGLTLKSIPKEQVSKSAAPFKTVRAYRNTILHNPVLGRGISFDGTFIVTEDHLRTAKESWSFAASLPADAFVSVSALLDQVAAEFLRGLEYLWSGLAAELLASPSFRRKFLHAMGSSHSGSAGRIAPSALSPISASGDFSMRAISEDDE
jgi:hypothetical protein